MILFSQNSAPPPALVARSKLRALETLESGPPIINQPTDLDSDEKRVLYYTMAS